MRQCDGLRGPSSPLSRQHHVPICIHRRGLCISCFCFVFVVVVKRIHRSYDAVDRCFSSNITAYLLITHEV